METPGGPVDSEGSGPAMSESSGSASEPQSLPPMSPPPMSPPPMSPPPMSPPPVRWEAPPEEVGPAPGFAFGGFGERLVAYIVDIVIVGLVGTLIGIVGGLVIAGGAVTGNVLAAGAGVLFTVAAVLVVTLAYFPYFWSRSGQTPGMKMFGLRVVRDSDGGPISSGQAVLRLLGYYVSGLVFYLGYIWIFFDKRKRGWHDLIASTVVVKRR
jgi:uncharacterized RDD family membrane protein YckC